MLVRGRSQATRSLCCPKCRPSGALPHRPHLHPAPIHEVTTIYGFRTSQARPLSQGYHLREQTGVRPVSAVGDARASGLKGLRSKTKSHKAQPPEQSNARHILGQSAQLPIRARFAPSPTGYLHLGSLRTALFNALAAEASKKGAFILRIEDTDQSRLVGDAEQRLIQDLKWAGLSWDEGPDCGGPYGPYRQSERLSTYREHVDTLIKNGHAYRCFCSPEKLESQKRELHEAGNPTFYPGTCRSVGPSESDRRATNGESFVVRLKGDAFGRPKFRDAIYGPFQKKDTEEDFVLLKTDGFPTYHLANVVDDHLMKITHVIRGEEWLISTPKHLALYEAFGWEPPTFAHLGLLVNADGTKLSKRNDSVNLAKYQNAGIFPMALLAWLANLGSSFKSDTKPPRLIADVADSLTFKFTRGGIKLNLEKLDYFQAKYRDAMLWEPRADMADSEARLIEEHVTLPMLREIDAVTRGDATASERLPAAWRGPLESVAALTGDESSRAKYVREIFAGKRNGFLSPDAVIRQHPYLLWRVPEDVYRQSLMASVPEKLVIQAIRNAVGNESLWDGQGGRVMDAIWAELRDHDIDNVMVHNIMRLVGAGGQDVVSQSSPRMVALLGRDEWDKRLSMVEKLMAEIEAT